MQTNQVSNQPQLYDQDYYLWLKTTQKQLATGDFSALDVANLVEELADMGKSEKRALISLLTRLVEHLLKLSYWEEEKERVGNHWASEIVNFRAQIETRLEDSPSLRSQLPALYEKAYPVAVKSVSKLFSLPPNAEITLSQTLDENWFPEEK